MFAHEEISSTHECLEIEDDSDERHCHEPGKEAVELSGEDKLLSMEVFLRLRKLIKISTSD